jgi:hypothetical protein
MIVEIIVATVIVVCCIIIGFMLFKEAREVEYENYP